MFSTALLVSLIVCAISACRERCCAARACAAAFSARTASFSARTASSCRFFSSRSRRTRSFSRSFSSAARTSSARRRRSVSSAVAHAVHMTNDFCACCLLRSQPRASIDERNSSGASMRCMSTGEQSKQ